MKINYTIYKSNLAMMVIYLPFKFELEIGHIGMRNVHPKGSMSFVLKLGQNCQEWIAEVPCGSKISTKLLYLAELRREKQICVFAFLAKILNGRQFWGEEIRNPSHG